MSDERPTIEVAAGVVFGGGKFLITQRLAGAHLGGLWEFPGGKREGGETLEECLRRELREELGIEVEVHELITAVTHVYPEKRVKLNFFRCSLATGVAATARGCAAFRWIAPGELSGYQFPEADRKLVDLLARGDMNFTNG